MSFATATQNLTAAAARISRAFWTSSLGRQIDSRLLTMAPWKLTAAAVACGVLGLGAVGVGAVRADALYFYSLPEYHASTGAVYPADFGVTIGTNDRNCTVDIPLGFSCESGQ